MKLPDNMLNNIIFGIFLVGIAVVAIAWMFAVAAIISGP